MYGILVLLVCQVSQSSSDCLLPIFPSLDLLHSYIPFITARGISRLTSLEGDGKTDDTDAINDAISSGNRCGRGCDSSTVSPALVYFPPGTYLVSKPLVQFYYTQFVGDAITIPTIKAAPSFQGIAVIDSDPYDDTGTNWYTNQNNFFRQIRNFVIDLTAMPASAGSGIHWQVAQVCSPATKEAGQTNLERIGNQPPEYPI